MLFLCLNEVYHIEIKIDIPKPDVFFRTLLVYTSPDLHVITLFIYLNPKNRRCLIMKKNRRNKFIFAALLITAFLINSGQSFVQSSGTAVTKICSVPGTNDDIDLYHNNVKA